MRGKLCRLTVENSGASEVPAIGLDAKRALYNHTGLGNYSRSVIWALHEFYASAFRFILFYPQKTHVGDTYNLPDGIKHVFPTFGGGVLWRSFGIIRAIRKYRTALYHGLSNEIPFIWGYNSYCRWVVTIHDLAFLRLSRDYTVIDKCIHYLKVAYACRRADAIVVVSEYTGKEIMRNFGVPPEKIRVIYPMVDPIFKVSWSAEERLHVQQSLQLPNQYFLFVGSVTARKNLVTALRAWLMLPDQFRLPFVVVGKLTRGYRRDLKHFLNSINQDLRQWVLFREVPTALLPAVYQGASLFVYPSLCEGFGLPVLEALQSGIPVVTSSTTSLPEVGGPGAFLADPAHPESIYRGYLHFLENENNRSHAIRLGYLHSTLFNPAEQAKKLAMLYSDLLKGTSGFSQFDKTIHENI